MGLSARPGVGVTAARAAPEPVIVATGVRKAFGKVEVLRGVDLTVSRGEVVVLMGPSGSGKSTFLRCVNRLIAPDGGRIVVSGVDMTDNATDLPRARRTIGFVAQHFNLYPHMSVLGNVMEAPRIVLGQSAADARTTAERLLARVGLADKHDARPRQLSGGQQQRVAIARALAMGPVVMLLDEPTSALDPELTGEVLDVMQELARDGMTMIVVSHEIHFAARVAHRLVMLTDGQVIEEGTPKEIMREPRDERTRRFLSRLMSWETDLSS